MIDIKVLELLNAPTAQERLDNLAKVLAQTTFPPVVPEYINNHIHTTYSFSPYSPTAAVWFARILFCMKKVWTSTFWKPAWTTSNRPTS